jgi:hypothetical protein
VNIKDLIRADKTDLDTGKWAKGHIPRAAFPLSKLKDKKYKYGPEYSWRVIKFKAESASCRVLVWFNSSKEILRARLGVEVNGDMVVLCDHEFHASEPGWHCHVTFEDVATRTPGVARNTTKWPRTIKPAARFGVTEANALTIVSEFFRLKSQGELI